MTSKRLLLACAVALSVTAGPALARPKKLPAAPEIPAVRDVDWVKIDPDNLLVIDTSRGRLLAELYPSMAPKTVERIKTLAKRHFYDGLTFFRVIDQFMAQTGDPTNTGAGGSDLPDLPGEFTFARDMKFPVRVLTTDKGEMAGLSGPMPVATQSDALLTLTAAGKVDGWGLFCPGVLGMARADKPDSGNSQFFIIRQTSPSIDRRYTAFGRVLVGLDLVRLIKVGEPVPAPQDSMTRVRLASDLPEGEKVSLARLDVNSPTFLAATAVIRDRKGPDFNVCDVDVAIKQD
jgi:peptidylprolyl isomerase